MLSTVYNSTADLWEIVRLTEPIHVHAWLLWLTGTADQVEQGVA
jgi:hypothetical protein